MSEQAQWFLYDQEKPERDRNVEWIAPDGRQVRGKFLGGCIWMPDGSNTYVYYTPVFWRYV